MIEQFAGLGWIQSIALAACWISVVWALGFLINRWHERRHERLKYKMEQEHEITREINNVES